VPDKARSDVVDFVVRRLEQLLVDGGVPLEAARAVLAERADNPALAAESARQLAAEMAAGEGGALRRVMMAFSRPTRIVRGKEVGPLGGGGLARGGDGLAGLLGGAVACAGNPPITGDAGRPLSPQPLRWRFAAQQAATPALQARSRGLGAQGPISTPRPLLPAPQVDPSWAVDASLMELQEERDLLAAYMSVSEQVSAGASVPTFLAACEALVAPIDGYFEKVFVMAEDEAVRRSRLALLRDVAGLTKGVLDLSQLPGF
jgi:glycyl-tRNA synthetase beta subunit